MQISINRKYLVAGAVIGLGLSLYLAFGDHGWLDHRAPLELDLPDLAQISTGPLVLERFRDLKLRCGVQEILLGEQACGAAIESFNGIPAQHVAFYFDAAQNLTAWKLTVEAEHYPALQAHLAQRYGAPPPGEANPPLLIQPLGEGLLAQEPPTTTADEPIIFWLRDSNLIRGLSGG